MKGIYTYLLKLLLFNNNIPAQNASKRRKADIRLERPATKDETCCPVLEFSPHIPSHTAEGSLRKGCLFVRTNVQFASLHMKLQFTPPLPLYAIPQSQYHRPDSFFDRYVLSTNLKWHTFGLISILYCNLGVVC